jgi:DNA-directed RNA polymerase subunit M/transcription elongation factor TFIIS
MKCPVCEAVIHGKVEGQYMVYDCDDCGYQELVKIGHK